MSFAQDTLSEQVLLLGEYNGHLESNDDEIEVSLCPIFSVAGTTRSHCEDGALKLVQAFEQPHQAWSRHWVVNASCGPP